MRMKQSQIERLTRLAELRGDGTLTEEEFQTEKRRLLDGGSGRLRWPHVAVGAALVACGVGGAVIWTGQKTEITAIPSKPITPPAPPPTVSIPEASSPRSAAERLQAAFLAATGHSRAFVQKTKDDEFKVSPVRIVDLPFGPALIVKREIESGCHGCAGYLAIYYLRESGDVTVVTASYPEAVSGWGWGSAPSEWQITNRFTSNPAIYASGGFTGQGITLSSSTITELRADGPHTSDRIGTGYDDEGSITEESGKTVCSVDGKIAGIVKDRSFDVVVSGSLTARDHYVMRGGRFVATKTIDWDMACPSQW